MLGSAKAQHFTSNGGYYSFGNSSAYRIIENSSLETYANKTSNSATRQKTINSNAMEIELLVAKEIRTAVSSLQKKIRDISLLISPVLDAAYILQKTMGDVNLSQAMTSNCGAWQSQICVNAST